MRRRNRRFYPDDFSYKLFGYRLSNTMLPPPHTLSYQITPIASARRRDTKCKKSAPLEMNYYRTRSIRKITLVIGHHKKVLSVQSLRNVSFLNVSFFERLFSGIQYKLCFECHISETFQSSNVMCLKHFMPRTSCFSKFHVSNVTFLN